MEKTKKSTKGGRPKEPPLSLKMSTASGDSAGSVIVTSDIFVESQAAAEQKAAL